MTDRLNLLPRHRKELEALLRKHVPEVEVWAYGSRVNGLCHEASDLDLALRGPNLEPLGSGYPDLLAALEQSNIPILVQAHDWARLPESFHREIERDHVVMQQGADRSEWRSMPFSEAVIVNPPVRLQQGVEYPFVDMVAVNPGIRWAYAERQRKHSGGGSRFQDCDTLMARITPCLENGKIARYRAMGDMTTAHGSTEFIVIRGRPDVTESEFAYYLTQSPAVRDYAVSQMTGTSGRQRVPTAALDHIDVALPPLSEQRAIAHVLGTLDDKIELNRRMNETLEQMARAIFQDWFVDFGPVRAKLEGREPYLPEELWELFPDRLVDSELGEIPEGWEVKALDEIADYRNGLALQKFRPIENEERLPVVKIAQLRTGKSDGGEWAKASITPHCIIDDGDVIFSWSGSLLIKVWCGGPAALNQHLFKVTSSQYPKWFYFCCTEAHLPAFQAIAAGKTTTMGHIKREHLREAKCAVPDAALITAVDGILAELLSKTVSGEIESRALAAQRDVLLPMLVSGELRADGR